MTTLKANNQLTFVSKAPLKNTFCNTYPAITKVSAVKIRSAPALNQANCAEINADANLFALNRSMAAAARPNATELVHALKLN